MRKKIMFLIPIHQTNWLNIGFPVKRWILLLRYGKAIIWPIVPPPLNILQTKTKPKKRCSKTYRLCLGCFSCMTTFLISHFSLNWPHCADSVKELPCPSVCLSVCAIRCSFFKASYCRGRYRWSIINVCHIVSQFLMVWHIIIGLPNN